MAIAETIKRLLGAEENGVDLTEYRCTECGHTFDSAKRPERAQCMECLSNEVEPAG